MIENDSLEVETTVGDFLAAGRNCRRQPGSSNAMKVAKRFTKLPVHFDFAEAIIVACDEIIAYASAVSGLEVVGEAT